MGAVAFGEKVKIGDIKTLHHAVSGEVYALDDKTLMVQNFNYDGAGPDAFFWVGVDGTPAETTEETTAILAHPFQGVHYKYRDESAPVLKAASNEAVTLILPEGMKVSDLKWLSVWCRRFTVDFGNVMFPADLKIPGASICLPHWCLLPMIWMPRQNLNQNLNLNQKLNLSLNLNLVMSMDLTPWTQNQRVNLPQSQSLNQNLALDPLLASVFFLFWQLWSHLDCYNSNFHIQTSHIHSYDSSLVSYSCIV